MAIIPSARSVMLLDSRLLNTFIAAANTQTFTAAASKVNMTQSGVSQQIARLEEQIGVSLFRWIGKRVVLTSEGHALKRHVIEQISITQQLVKTCVRPRRISADSFRMECRPAASCRRISP